MTQEEKELVLKDICTRLPYGVYVEISWEYSKTDVHTSIEYYEFPNIDSLFNMFWDEKCISIKPYIRQISSMTEEEKKIYRSKQSVIFDFKGNKLYVDNYHSLDYLDSIHVDYRGMIERKLAIKSPEEMYK